MGALVRGAGVEPAGRRRRPRSPDCRIHVPCIRGRGAAPAPGPSRARAAGISPRFGNSPRQRRRRRSLRPGIAEANNSAWHVSASSSAGPDGQPGGCDDRTSNDSRCCSPSIRGTGAMLVVGLITVLPGIGRDGRPLRPREGRACVSGPDDRRTQRRGHPMAGRWHGAAGGLCGRRGLPGCVTGMGAADAEEDPLLDRFMPAYEVVERLRAPPRRRPTLAAARDLDLSIESRPRHQSA